MPTNDKFQDDPNLKLPKSVRDAAARSEQLVQQINEQNATEEVTLQGNQDAASLLATPVNLIDSATVELQTQQDPPAEPNAPEDGSWEQKYNSMYGRVKTLDKHNRALQDQINNLQAVISTMTENASAAADIPDITVARLVTDEEENDYGKDLLAVVGKKAQETIAPLLKAQADKIKELEGKLGGVQSHVVQDAHQKMLADMDGKLPEWREINTNNEFLAWLALPDTYSGVIRHDMLKAAYSAGNAPRVLAFFNGFLAEEAATKPVTVPKPEPSTTTVDRVSLESLAAPGKAKSAAAPTPAEKPLIQRAQIAAFYADVAAGRYKGRDAEKNALEQQIFAANRDGRIR